MQDSPAGRRGKCKIMTTAFAVSRQGRLLPAGGLLGPESQTPPRGPVPVASVKVNSKLLLAKLLWRLVRAPVASVLARIYCLRCRAIAVVFCLGLINCNCWLAGWSKSESRTCSFPFAIFLNGVALKVLIVAAAGWHIRIVISLPNLIRFEYSIYHLTPPLDLN